MPQADDSSAELNRLEVIGVCRHTLRAITDERRRKTAISRQEREKRIQELMHPRKNLFGKLVSRTRQDAEKYYLQVTDDLEIAFGNPMLLYKAQEDILNEILALAEACEADTIRITKRDFSSLKNFWGKK